MTKMDTEHRDWIFNYIEENYPDETENILLADGFEKAFMGVVEVKGQKPRACYDVTKCIDSLRADGMELCDAMEYFDFNVRDAYVGEYTPAFMFAFDPEWDSVEGGWTVPTEEAKMEEMRKYPHQDNHMD
jgi:hypothetical protein